jgi:hypothetical protein
LVEFKKGVTSMTRFRAVLCFFLVAIVVLGVNAMAANNRVSTHSESFMETAHTTSMTAVYAPFVAAVIADAGPNPIDTAISISNTTDNPGGDNNYYDPMREIGPVEGTEGGYTIYLFSSDGEIMTWTSPDPLGPGMTDSFFLSEVAADVSVEVQSFTGYIWVVADFGAVAGTVTNFWTVFNTSGSYLMQPTMGGIPVSGIPAPMPQ